MKTQLIILLSLLTVTSYAQIERPKWELGGGIRLNYSGLSGGFSGLRYSDGYEFDIDYHEIGMDTYSPSIALAIGGRYKKWNLEFAGSRGNYEGSFIIPADIVRDDQQIDSGSVVSGSVDLTMYAISTSFGLIQRKHDLGIGIGFLVLNMGSNYTTTNTIGEEVKMGGDEWFPMPFLALSGRLKFNDFRISGTAGGAIFRGSMEDINYDVDYITADANVAYDFLNRTRWALSADVGYRFLYLNLDMDNENGWYKEDDIYQGPYATVRVKFFSKEMWQFTKRKDRKKENNN